MSDDEEWAALGLDPNDDPYDLTPHPDRAPDDAEPDLPELFARAVRGDGIIGDVLLGFPDEDVDIDEEDEGGEKNPAPPANPPTET